MIEDKNELALFSGVGGGILATKHLLGWRTVCYVEHSKYAVDVLKARMRDGYLDDAPIWDDCFTFDGYPWRGVVDIISAGFPCQPFSQAGKGLAENDPRNGWPATIRIIDEVRPSIACLENVPGLISKSYIRRIFGELAEVGYDAEWGCLSAQAVGANHKRERLWIIAYDNSITRPLSSISWDKEKAVEFIRDGETPGTLADADGQRCEASRPREPQKQCKERTMSWVAGKSIPCSTWWQVEPELGRVADGVAHRVDRLSAIGNGQVPAVAASAWKFLLSRSMAEL